VEVVATEKRLISVGDVVYIIGKYSFSPDEDPQVVEAQVAYTFRKRLYAYPTKGHGTFSFNNGDLGKTVFFNRDDAERILRRILDASD
jgi:hypothetical protein